MQYLTSKGIKNYLINNYGELRHEPTKLKIACQKISKIYKCTPLEVFHFMIEQTPISNLHTHSYGFNTSLGRDIRNEFKYYYYNN